MAPRLHKERSQMTHHRRARGLQAGYSVAEMLVVVAIIGLITLVSIPQFMAFQRSNQLKGSMRQMLSDLRLARQQAIALRTQTRVRFQTNTREYTVEQLNGSTWSQLGRSGNAQGARALEKTCTFTTPSNLPTVTVNSTTYNVITFRPEGTAVVNASPGSFNIQSAFPLPVNRYIVQVDLPGFVKANKP
jgi:Tfp pilus assembly protein FimT